MSRLLLLCCSQKIPSLSIRMRASVLTLNLLASSASFCPRRTGLGARHAFRTVRCVSSNGKDVLVTSTTASNLHPSATSSSCCVLYDGDQHEPVASALAAKLSLPLLSTDEFETPSRGAKEFTHALSVLDYESLSHGVTGDFAIGINALTSSNQPPTSRRRRKPSMKPCYVDFFPPPSSKLGRRKSSGGDLLLRAVAPRKKEFADEGAVVYDLTAGLGQDSLLIAQAGAREVHMVERDPIVATLLDDGLRRLQLLGQQSHKAADLSSRLSLTVGDGREVAKRLDEASARPGIVYLDPMFPVRKKSAKVQKNMEVLHGLLGSQEQQPVEAAQEDERSLLEAAYELAKVRMVVKRPIHASPLGGPSQPRQPSYAVKGSTNRWDVYAKASAMASE